MAASRLLVDDDPALDEQRRVLLPPARDGRNPALVELNLTAGAGAAEVAGRFLERFESVFGAGAANRPPPPQQISGYLRCWLTPAEIRALLAADGGAGQPATIFRIWPDYVLHPHLDQSVSTISVDAAQRVYTAAGSGIVWAVIDSGVDGSHPHFAAGTVSDPGVCELHRDFIYLVRGDPEPEQPRSRRGAEGRGRSRHACCGHHRR